MFYDFCRQLSTIYSIFQIALKLKDFSLWRDGQNTGWNVHNSPEKTGVCHIYAQVREDGTSILGRQSASTLGSVTLCGSEERSKTVYTSEAEALTVDIADMKLAKSPSYFMLHYQGKISYPCTK